MYVKHKREREVQREREREVQRDLIRYFYGIFTSAAYFSPVLQKLFSVSSLTAWHFFLTSCLSAWHKFQQGNITALSHDWLADCKTMHWLLNELRLTSLSGVAKSISTFVEDWNKFIHCGTFKNHQMKYSNVKPLLKPSLWLTFLFLNHLYKYSYLSINTLS